MSSVPVERPAFGAGWTRQSLGVGLGALLVCAVAAFFDPAQFFRVYLSVYIFVLGLGLGCLAILMLYHLTGGAWGFVTRRILEAGTRTLPLLAVLFLPVAGGASYLYLWAQPAVVAVTPKLQDQHIYLNVPFFLVRAVLYFVVWLTLNYFLNSWADAQERGEHVESRLARLSAVGLVLHGICIHFAAVDWVMSLQPVFHSTIFGPLLASGQLVLALGLVIIVLACECRRPPLEEAMSAEVFTDLGNLLLAFLIIWAYMAWFQFMLIWIANLPVDVIWYLPRSEGGWEWVMTAIAVLHFAVPFFMLLIRTIKQTPRLLAVAAGLVLFMQLPFDYYQVLPAFQAPRLSQHWLDFLIPLGLGGLWLACFLWQLGRRPLLPRQDGNAPAAYHLRRLDETQAALEEALSHG